MIEGNRRMGARQMKRIEGNLVGVDQGSELLFEDYKVDGEMWIGSGSREAWHPVRFSAAFKPPPTVFVSISLWDIVGITNQRAAIRAANVRRDGFELVFATWEDTKVARIRADWMAIGALPNDDDWDVA